ncbi:MAG: phospholipase D-like domain-containing protein [Thermofilum sp.]
MSSSSSDVEKKIIQLLSGAETPKSSEFISTELKIPKNVVSAVLHELYKRGLIKKVYTPAYDPTRPFDTVSWVIAEKAVGTRPQQTSGVGIEEKLVMSKPVKMADLATAILNSLEALDLHDAYNYVIEEAKHELKMMSPVIDVYAFYPLMSKLSRDRNLKVKILTEFSKSESLVHIISSQEIKNIEVRNAEKYAEYGGRRRKIFGIHAKIVIADENVALVGSFNFSSHHYIVNFDLGFLIHDAQVVRKISRLFDELWNYVSSPDRSPVPV